MLRLREIICAAMALICTSTTVNAADFKTVGLSGNQRLRISGPIEPGDHESLIELLRHNPAYPAGILIDSGGGDLAASIDIGQFARDAMLPVTATGSCGGGCVLIWIAGIQRATRTNLDPKGLALQADNIQDYLHHMEVDDETIGRLLTSPPLSPEQALDLLGATSPNHESRLAERCGTLDEQQYDDWRAVQSLAAVDSALNAMAQGMGGGQAMYVVDPETERQAATARALSPDYRRELDTLQTGITKCRHNAVAEWRTPLPKLTTGQRSAE